MGELVSLQAEREKRDGQEHSIKWSVKGIDGPMLLRIGFFLVIFWLTVGKWAWVLVYPHGFR